MFTSKALGVNGDGIGTVPIDFLDGDVGIDEANDEFVFNGGANCLYLIWNNEWSEFQSIQDIHLYSHGAEGHANMYNSPETLIEEVSMYPKLNWEETGKIYFHGCHTAEIYTHPKTKKIYYPLQECANNQGVLVYGNRTAANLSSDPKEYKKITDTSENVYLGAYGISPKDVRDNDEDTWLTRKWAGNNVIPMTVFSPE